MYYWLTVFSPRVVNFSLVSLSTNWKYPHSQKASWNDFRGPSVQALPHPSRVSLARARSLFRSLLPSARYAGYTDGEDFFLRWSRVCQALRPIFMLWLVKIWRVSSCGKFMQLLETCLGTCQKLVGGRGVETEGGSQLFETAENGLLKGGGSRKYVSVIM